MRRNVKLLVTSDLHLSPRIWRHREILNDSYFAWELIVEAAITEGVDAVVLAGDILDKQSNPSEVIVHLLQGLNRLRHENIPVLYVQGQHEFQSKPWLSLGESPDSAVTWLHDREVNIGGWRIAGSDFRPKAEFQEFLQGELVKAADVLVCHQVWEDFMGSVAVTQGSFSDVPPNVDLLITGDYHVHCERNRGNLRVLSPGSTHLRSVSEPPEKSLFLLELVPDGQHNVVSLELPTRKFILMDLLSVPDDELTNQETTAAIRELLLERLHAAEKEAAADELPPQLLAPIVYFKYYRSAAELVNQLSRYIEDRAHVFYRAIAEDSSTLPVAAREHAVASTSLMAKLPEYFDPQVDKEKFRLAVGLLNADDPLLYLEKWLDKESENEN
jgi:DNA repair exonuclease SbcCD nuclease subunit